MKSSTGSVFAMRPGKVFMLLNEGDFFRALMFLLLTVCKVFLKCLVFVVHGVLGHHCAWTSGCIVFDTCKEFALIFYHVLIFNSSDYCF